MRETTRKSAKNRAWKAFADFIKFRDSGRNGLVKCCTCPKILHYKDRTCNAGHFVGSRSESVLFREDIVHAQCCACNASGGEQAKYAMFMKKKYNLNDDQIEELLNLRHTILKRTQQDYLEIEATYKNKLEALKLMRSLACQSQSL